MRKAVLRSVALLVIVTAAAGGDPPLCFGDDCDKCGTECSTPATKTCLPGAPVTDMCECDLNSCETIDCPVE